MTFFVLFWLIIRSKAIENKVFAILITYLFELCIKSPDRSANFRLKVLRNGINDLMNLFKKQGLAEDSTSTWCRIKH